MAGSLWVSAVRLVDHQRTGKPQRLPCPENQSPGRAGAPFGGRLPHAAVRVAIRAEPAGATLPATLLLPTPRRDANHRTRLPSPRPPHPRIPIKTDVALARLFPFMRFLPRGKSLGKKEHGFFPKSKENMSFYQP